MHTANDDVRGNASWTKVQPYDQQPWLKQLIEATKSNNTVLVEALLADHVKESSLGDVNGFMKHDRLSKETPLYHAVDGDSLDVLKLLVRHPGIDLDALLSIHMPALFMATMMTRRDQCPDLFIDVLIEAGANPHLTINPLGDDEKNLVDAVISFSGLHAGPIFDVLHRHDLLPMDHDSLSKMLLHAVATLQWDEPTSTVNWLLDHHAPLDGLHKDGRSIADLAAEFQRTAPLTFTRVEQAVLLEQANQQVPGPSTPRARL